MSCPCMAPPFNFHALAFQFPAIGQLHIINLARAHEPLACQRSHPGIQPPRKGWQGLGNHDLHWAAAGLC